MVYFELLKIRKNKIINNLLLFAIILAIFLSTVVLKFSNMHINNAWFGTAYYQLPQYLDLRSNNNRHLTEKDILDVRADIDSAFFSNLMKMEEIGYPEKYSYEELQKLTKINNEYIKQLNNIINKYNLDLGDQNLQSWKITMYEVEERERNNTLKSALVYDNQFNNICRIIILNSNIIFGLPFIIFLVLLFHGTISKEKESERINFLITQPIDRWKINFSKFISIIISAIIGIFFIFIFCIVVFYLFGYRFYNGQYEIYRILNNNCREVKHM